MTRMGLAAVAIIVAACGDTTATSPATAPPTLPPTTTSPAPTTSAPPTTTTAPATTLDRVGEIEAIFRDLEFRRLDALYRNDEEAYRSAFSSPGYLTQSLALEFGQLEFVAAPTKSSITVAVLAVLADTEDCIAAELSLDFPSLGPEATGVTVKVVQVGADGIGLAFGGSGWLCEGPNPLDE